MNILEKLQNCGIRVEVDDANPFDDGEVGFKVRVKVADLVGMGHEEKAKAAETFVKTAQESAKAFGIPWLDKLIGKK